MTVPEDTGGGGALPGVFLWKTLERGRGYGAEDTAPRIWRLEDTSLRAEDTCSKIRALGGIFI